MDIERLSKSQIILLTLLVSFVTSIATGIVTVSLMDQAPPSIAQTVNRVVERTVEKVVPSGQTAGAAAAAEKTILVTESDLIVKAVEAATPSIVRLYTTSLDATGKESDVFLGLGVVVSESGVIATDAASLPASGTLIVSVGDQRLSGTLISSDATSGLALLQGATSTAEATLAWKSATLSESKQSLGETVFTISGRTATRIGDGIVTALASSDNGSAEDIVETNIPVGSVAFGSPLVNMKGEIVGISTTASRLVSENAFGAAHVISNALKPASSEQDTSQQ
jgi:S1-C subfamily serine protease